MKKLQISVIAAAAVLFMAIEVDAQRRPAPRRTPPRVVTTTPPAATVAASAVEAKAGAEKVSTQIKNVTKFLYVLGGVARGIEDLDQQAKTTRVVQAAVTKNEENKREVIQAIRNLRAGIAALEVEFRTKPALKAHIMQLNGATQLTAQSEDLALSGRFTDSGKPLLLLVEKLSDTLVAMQ